ncbi:CDP-diacylglycerol--serine O-phosphatidyltransferase [Alicyclobacillus tolerans]|uniref:CDP-diacylglycerol--serine O-phosphatidyltransferase n=1 Tax=Alicyclobacillus tolerans TaxID=90970 RepID=A0A1M6VLM6_9BACL|nr:CDP-diacylglycerol--serine O-phosphatidyltransferase [Alicyclobacillus montanus]SHK82457.1 CDP-diacylglycerol---serine O-phosphatidyltransferase [Alicyclobacillus montanus]
MSRWVPSLLTLTNLFFGLIAIALSENGRVGAASILILSGMLIDAFDGRVARFLKAESEFGRQLDSLADVVTFGVAPMAVLYSLCLRNLGIFGALVGLIFPACGILRLARFHVENGPRRYFIGLPITAAGGVSAALALCYNLLPEPSVFLPVCVLLLSFLMVSHVRYPNFKRISFPQSALIGIPLLALGVYLVVRYGHSFAGSLVVLAFLIYLVFGAARALRKQRFDKEESLDEKSLPPSNVNP